MDMEPQERDAEICRLYVTEEKTLRAIGKQFKLTRERVRQILKQAGIDKNSRSLTMREEFLGVNLTEDVKEALRTEAERRKVSMSSLTSEMLSDMLVALGYRVSGTDEERQETARRILPSLVLPKADANGV